MAVVSTKSDPARWNDCSLLSPPLNLSIPDKDIANGYLTTSQTPGTSAEVTSSRLIISLLSFVFSH